MEVSSESSLKMTKIAQFPNKAAICYKISIRILFFPYIFALFSGFSQNIVFFSYLKIVLGVTGFCFVKYILRNVNAFLNISKLNLKFGHELSVFLYVVVHAIIVYI